MRTKHKIHAQSIKHNLIKRGVLIVNINALDETALLENVNAVCAVRARLPHEDVREARHSCKLYRCLPKLTLSDVQTRFFCVGILKMPVKRRPKPGRMGNVHGWVVENANGKVLFNFDTHLFDVKPNPCYTIFNTERRNANSNRECLKYMKSGGASNKNLRNGLKLIRNKRVAENARMRAARTRARTTQNTRNINNTHERLIKWFGDMLNIVPEPALTNAQTAQLLAMVPPSLARRKLTR